MLHVPILQVKSVHNQLFQTVFNKFSVPGAILKADAPYFTIVANNEAYKIITNSSDDITGKTVWEIFKPQNTYANGWQIIQNSLEAVIAHKQTYKMPAFRYDIPNADNSDTEQAWWEIELTPIVGEDNKVEYIVSTIHNITGQIIGREAIIKTETQAEALQKEHILNEKLAVANQELSTTNDELDLAQENLNQLNNNLEEWVNSRTQVLAEREARLRYMISDAPVAIGVLAGRELIVETANDMILQNWGKGKEVLGKPLHEVLPELEGQPFLQLLDNVFTSGVPYYANEAKVMLVRNGIEEETYFTFVYHPLKDAAGTCTSIMIVANEVTEQVKAKQHQQHLNDKLSAANDALSRTNEKLSQAQENLLQLNNELEARVARRTKALAESEGRFRSMIEQSPIAMLVNRGKDLVFETINQPMIDLIGKGDTVKGKTWYEAIPELIGQPIVERLYRTYINGEEWVGYEEPVMLNRNGKLEQRYYNLTYKPLLENGQITGVLQAALDVTEQVKSKQALAESEAQLRTIFDQAPLGMCLFKGKNLIVELANNNMLKIWGKTRNIFGIPYKEIRTEAEAKPYLKLLDEVYATGIAYRGHEVKGYFLREGIMKEGYYNFVYQPLKDDHGITNGILLIADDVTEKVLVRKEREKAEEMLMTAIESADLGTWFMDAESREFIASPRLKEIFGFNEDVLMSYEATMAQIDNNYKQAVTNAIENTITKREKFDLELPLMRYNDGKLRWIKSVGKLYNVNGKPGYIAGTVNDITDRKLDEIRKNDFISMVSHELRTPLTSLKAYTQLLTVSAKQTNDGYTLGTLHKINNQVNKMTNMVNSFLDVSRLESGKIHLDKTAFCLDELIKEKAEDISFTMQNKDICFVQSLPVKLYADYEKIGQVINNLLSNAIKYSPKGKPVEIACRQVNNTALVSVKDEGIGINPQDADKLFERFYRVENQQNLVISGFGIGLYLCAEIIQRHEGRIWVESELGKGSTFFSVCLLLKIYPENSNCYAKRLRPAYRTGRFAILFYRLRRFSG